MVFASNLTIINLSYIDFAKIKYIKKWNKKYMIESDEGIWS